MLAAIGESHPDVVVVCGDICQRGTAEQARIAAAECAGLGVLVVAVLGNHDYLSGAADEVAAILAEAGVVVLRGQSVLLDLPGRGRLALVGAMGQMEAVTPRQRHLVPAAEYDPVHYRRMLTHRSIRAATAVVSVLHVPGFKTATSGEPEHLVEQMFNPAMGRAVGRSRRVRLCLNAHCHRGCERYRTRSSGLRGRSASCRVTGTLTRTYELDPRTGRVATVHEGLPWPADLYDKPAPHPGPGVAPRPTSARNLAS